MATPAVRLVLVDVIAGSFRAGGLTDRWLRASDRLALPNLCPCLADPLVPARHIRLHPRDRRPRQMPSRQSRSLAVIAAVGAAGLAAFALRPAPATSTSAARNPAVEIRTQVIRRTIHVIRHEPGAAWKGSRHAGAVVVTSSVRTAASGARLSGTAASPGALATRTSGLRAAPTSAAGPVTTRTSASGGAGATSGHPVTRSSGGRHGEGGDGGSDD